MANSADDFVNYFYNLQEITISHRKKEFFKLLKNSNLIENDEQMNSALKKMQPRNYLESLFYIDTLIYFKKSAELLQIFKQGNEVFISKIIKQNWFLKEAFKDFSMDQVVNEFLPLTSFAIRMKVLKKLSINLDESQMDQLFDCVRKRYGLRVASSILHSCSSTKITEVLSNSDITLSPRQLKFVVDKNVNTFEMYLDHCNTKLENTFLDTYSDENVIKYISIKHPQLTLELLKNNKIWISKLGRRTSKRMIHLIRDDIVKDVEYYLSFLNNRVMVRKLGKFVYYDLFPRNENDVNSSHFSNQILRFYPKKRQWDLLVQTFSEVFGNKDLLENLNLLDFGLIKLCPIRNITHKWAEIKYKETNNESLLQYFEPSKAITIIKSKINVTSAIHERNNLLNLMIDMCKYNNSLSSLENVLSYFCFRHRNENIYVKHSFLNYIDSKYGDEMDTFTEKHWQYIYEQIDVIRVSNKDYNVYESYSHLLKKYIEYFVKSGKPVTNELKQFIEHCISSNCSFLLELDNPPIEREILVKICDLLPNFLDEQNPKSSSLIYSSLIEDLINFSRGNRDHHISLLNFPFIMEYIKSLYDKTVDLDINDFHILNRLVIYNLAFPEMFKIEETVMHRIILNIAKKNSCMLVNLIKETKDDHLDFVNEMLKIVLKSIKLDPFTLVDLIEEIKHTDLDVENEALRILLDINRKTLNTHLLVDLIEEKVTKHDRTNLENELLQFYFDKVIDKHTVHAIHLWFIKNEPKIVLPHIDKIVENSLYLLRNYKYKSQRSVNNKHKNDHIMYLKEIKLFSHLGFDIKYIEFFKTQLKHPSNASMKHIMMLLSLLDSTDDLVAFVEENFIPKKEKLDMSDTQMRKEYPLLCTVAKALKNVVEPLKMLPVIVKFCMGDFLKSALSSLYSIFCRSPENQLYFYIDVLSSKGAISVKKHAFFLSCEVLNYDFAIRAFKTIKDSNISSQKHLFSVALKFFLKNLSQESFDVVISNIHTIDKNDQETLRNLIFIQIPNKYRALYLEKCWQFFEDLREKEVYVVNYLDSMLHNLPCEVISSLSSEFCEKIFTLYFKEQIDVLSRIKMFICHILRYKEAEQINNFNTVFEILCTLKNKYDVGYVKEFLTELYSVAAQSNSNFIKLCNESINQFFMPVEMFHEFALFKLLYLKVESSEPFAENFAEQAVLFIEQVTSEYGFLIYNNLLSPLDTVLKGETKTDRLLFFYNILKFGVNPFNCLMVLDLMDFNYKGNLHSEKKVYRDIVKILRDVEDPVVKIKFYALNLE